MSEKKTHRVYQEEFKRQAVEMVIRSGKPIVQIGRELGVSEASLHAWRKAYFLTQSPVPGAERSQNPEQMFSEIRRLQKENEYL